MLGFTLRTNCGSMFFLLFSLLSAGKDHWQKAARIVGLRVRMPNQSQKPSTSQMARGQTESINSLGRAPSPVEFPNQG